MKVDYAELLSSPGMFEAFRASSSKNRNETLQTIYDSLKRCLIEKGRYDEKFHASLFISLCEAIGGTQLYIPTEKYLFKVLNEISIFKEFTGNNQHELALKYKVTPKAISDIVARQRKYQKLARDGIDGIGIKHA